MRTLNTDELAVRVVLMAAQDMRELRIFWLPLLFILVGGVIAVACDDSSSGNFGEYAPYARSTSGTDPADASVSDGAQSGSSATDARASASDANSDAALDAANSDAGDAGPPPNAFTDAGPFTPDSGATTIQPSHDFAGNVPVMNPSKQACLNCHQATGAAPVFVLGGSVFADDAGTPAAGAEVRISDGAGNTAVTYSDALGNFFVETSSVTFPAEVGVRTATSEALMVSTAANGNCNSCHDGNAQAFIHVP